jgi:2-methylisocitrate lyase-like PEP mutase family enzyme
MRPNPSKILRTKLLERRGLLVPGAANALAARVIEDLGFEAVYLSGAGLTNSLWGMPDLGFISLPELAQHTAAVRQAVNLPIIVDADTGFGNAVNVWHCVRMLERAGADAIQIEDQIMPKKCGHFANKSVIPADEMVGKIKAAVDGRTCGDFVVIARTDFRGSPRKY